MFRPGLSAVIVRVGGMDLTEQLPPDWRAVLDLDPLATAALGSFVGEEYENQTVYPPREDLFAAFHRTPYADARVLILGQDPYHGPGQAHGLSFSVREGVRLPPSLRNIYKELAADLGVTPPASGDLTSLQVRGDGSARLVTTTDSVTLNDVKNRALIIHSGADNFGNIPDRYQREGGAGPDDTTLATGDAGSRVACGVVH